MKTYFYLLAGVASLLVAAFSSDAVVIVAGLVVGVAFMAACLLKGDKKVLAKMAAGSTAATVSGVEFADSDNSHNEINTNPYDVSSPLYHVYN